jgi:hypothetical protein
MAPEPYCRLMTWDVALCSELRAEWGDLPESVQDEILALGKVLGQFGPRLGRPKVDTLSGSRFPNMKELRFDAEDGVWRVAFAFDPMRRAILLVAGDKSGMSSKLFYERLIARADTRYTAHLQTLKNRGIRRGPLHK